MNLRRAVVAALVLAPAVAAACGSNGGSDTPGGVSGLRAAQSATAVIIGDGASAPVAESIPVSDSWPQWFFRTGLSRNTVLVNLSTQVAPVHLAVRMELPVARELHPTIAAVLLGFADLAERAPPSDMADSLEALVLGLRAAGARTVLLGTLPDELTDTAPYNAAIRNVARRDGAVLVDLTPLYVSFVRDPAAIADVPDRASQRVIGAAFASAYRAAVTAPVRP